MGATERVVKAVTARLDDATNRAATDEDMLMRIFIFLIGSIVMFSNNYYYYLLGSSALIDTNKSSALTWLLTLADRLTVSQDILSTYDTSCHLKLILWWLCHSVVGRSLPLGAL